LSITIIVVERKGGASRVCGGGAKGSGEEEVKEQTLLGVKGTRDKDLILPGKSEFHDLRHMGRENGRAVGT